MNDERIQVDRPLMTPRKRESPCWLVVKVRAPTFRSDETATIRHINLTWCAWSRLYLAFNIRHSDALLITRYLCMFDQRGAFVIIAYMNFYKVDDRSSFHPSELTGREERRPRATGTLAVCLLRCNKLISLRNSPIVSRHRVCSSLTDAIAASTAATVNWNSFVFSPRLCKTRRDG